MNDRVTRRFVKLMALLIVGAMLFWLATEWFSGGEPGDYQVRVGDQRLSEGNYEDALEAFDKALDQMPDHRGALMGRALVFMQTDRHDAAFAEFRYMIDVLSESVAPDDPTGRAVLAAAYANRGILHDRRGEYQEALEDYIRSIQVDEGAVEGPGVIHEILYGYKPSTIRDRAIYIHEQLQLPEDQRRLAIPELDEEQRMYKP
ncbi:MAG: tetratricopeptide repeat protein [Alphaproteobacteria bacterium]|nr:tetratricopeptide repeat protein [Alphaproteobacteria bacterium]